MDEHFYPDDVDLFFEGDSDGIVDRDYSPALSESGFTDIFAGETGESEVEEEEEGEDGDEDEVEVEDADDLEQLVIPWDVASPAWTVNSRSSEASSSDSLFVEQVVPRAPAQHRDELISQLQRLQERTRQLRQQREAIERLEQNLRRSVAAEAGRINRGGPSESPAPPRRRFHPYRHSPHPHPPAPNHPRNPHASDDEDDNESIGVEVTDELVEMEVSRPRSLAGRRTQTPGPSRPAAVIDLTEVPDSPEEIQVLPNSNNRAQSHQARRWPSRAQQSAAPPHHLNPRRQASFNHRTPSLARSDGSVLGGAPVIDLTGMDDDDDAFPRRPPAPPRRRVPPAVPIEIDDDRPSNDVGSFFGRLVDASRNMNMGLFRHLGGVLGQERVGGAFEAAQIMERAIRDASHFRANLNMPNPLAQNVPNFNYRANGYNNGPPKPVHVPPPAPREGFSRATGEDLAFVCPSCEEELKYDPDEEAPKSPLAKRARTRKDREEHHFWAVKECGHVYCKTCYENRKPSARNPHKTAFRVKADSRKLFCAVDDCQADVNPKAAWVGLFL